MSSKLISCYIYAEHFISCQLRVQSCVSSGLVEVWKSLFLQFWTRTMSPTGIFCIFLAFSVQVKAASQGHICVTDYWHTISCSLKLPITSARNISYWLEAQSIITNQNYSCQLQRVHEDHICNFTVELGFMSVDEYSMTLHYLENGTRNSSLLDASFEPVKNIKPKTPFNLMLQYENGTYHFFWKSGYEDHVYRKALPIIYEFKYYKDGDQTSEVSVQPDKEIIQIDEMKLDPDTMYTVMVKSKVDKTKEYSGTWSDWSSAVKWKTAYRSEYGDEPSQVSKIAIGIFAMVGLLILLMAIPAARFKMKEISWVPTPATYFQPLYQNYQGNFQCWVLAKSPLQDFQVMEDFSKIDKISEVLTTLPDQVEKTYMYPTAQCHTPYVAPTAEVWAPCQMPDTAPVIFNPVPACFKQDYCTLTNTPTGPVPTFTRDVEQDQNTSND